MTALQTAAPVAALQRPAGAASVLARRSLAGTKVAHRQPTRPSPSQRSCQRPAVPVAQSAAGGPPAAAEIPAVEATSKQQLDWEAQWWPIVYTKDIPASGIYGFRLLDQPIVIWRDGEGRYRCFKDACPHRLVPLSEGRIDPNGQLQCAYHGWSFSGCGACTAMPQGGDPAATRSAATAFCCTELQGLVWVKLQPAPKDGSEPDTSAIPRLPELDDPDWFAFGDMFRDIPYDYATLIENVVDAGHVPFTHHGSVSKRQSSGDYNTMHVTERSEHGFKGIWPTGPRKGALGAQHTLFHGPALMRHTIDAYGTRGFANVTAVYGVPVSPGRCRAIVRQPFRFKNKLLPLAFKIMPAFMGHLGNNSVLDEDVIFLHKQEEESARRGLGDKPVGQVYFMPGASDAYVAAFRTWLQTAGGGGPWGPMDERYLQRAGPRLPEDQLLDHYHSHTERCSICRPALRNVRVACAAAAAVSIAATALAAMSLLVQWATAGALLPSAPAVVAAAGKAGKAAAQQAAAAAGASWPPLVNLAGMCAAVAVVAFFVWRWCQQTIPRFIKGSLPYSRNRVPGEYAP